MRSSESGRRCGKIGGTIGAKKLTKAQRSKGGRAGLGVKKGSHKRVGGRHGLKWLPPGTPLGRCNKKGCQAGQVAQMLRLLPSPSRGAAVTSAAVTDRYIRYLVCVGWLERQRVRMWPNQPEACCDPTRLFRHADTQALSSQAQSTSPSRLKITTCVAPDDGLVMG